MIVSNMNIPFDKERLGKLLAGVKTDVYKTEEVFCRDPYILLCGDYYFLYKNHSEDGNSQRVIACQVSKDLQTWSKPIPVFEPSEDFHGKDHLFWAPECHYYKGYFYIFTSVREKSDNRHTISVYRADNPLGPFVDIAGGCISPRDWDSIDGTLYVDEEGAPWLVFVHEWICMPEHNGSMVAARLSEDFTKLISEPVDLFYAKEPEWADRGVTDGCYMVKASDNRILMLWSNFIKNPNVEHDYCLAVAYSDNGKIDGKWSHCKNVLYRRNMKNSPFDGGHGMVFFTKEGKPSVVFHSPNIKQGDVFEHPVIYELKEEDKGLVLGDKIA